MKLSEIEGLTDEQQGAAKLLDEAENVTRAITAHVAGVVERRVEVKAEEFKSKMDALDAKRRAAEERAAKAIDVDPDEYEAMKQAAEKSPELTATLEAMKGKTAEAERRLAEQSAELERVRLDHTLTSAIDKYNAEHPTRQMPAEMREVALMMGRQAVRYDESAKEYRVFDDKGGIVATDQGAATPLDWLVQLREAKPRLFDAPAGGGARGSEGGSGAGEGRTVTRAEFDRMDVQGKAAAAREMRAGKLSITNDRAGA